MSQVHLAGDQGTLHQLRHHFLRHNLQVIVLVQAGHQGGSVLQDLLRWSTSELMAAVMRMVRTV